MSNFISLSKENNSMTVKLSKEKPAGRYGKIDVNLNWSQKKKGLFGMFSKPVDLDLGCLFELKDGTKKTGCIQALGNAFGSFDSAPYISLDGDDRTGESQDGEWMRINGDQWSQIKRIVIYAFIYDGVPSWNETDGVVKFFVNGETIEVKMDNSKVDKRLCAVALLENVGDEIKVQRLVEYYNDQEKLDRAYSWGMRWSRGTKD